MILYRRNPTSSIFGLHRGIDRLVDEMFSHGSAATHWSPPTEIVEDRTELRLAVELPGVAPEQVEITVERGTLIIRGEKGNEQKEDADRRYQGSERRFGSFVRSFRLPGGIDEDRITADFRRGVLTIHLPQAARPQPKRIRIEQVEGNGERRRVEATAM